MPYVINDDSVNLMYKPGNEVTVSMNDPISRLNLRGRTVFCLQSAKINTIQELCQRSEQDLREIEYLGSKAIQEIIEELSSKGLELDEDPSEYRRFQDRFGICSDPWLPPVFSMITDTERIKTFLTLPQEILDELKEIGLVSNWALILEQPTLEKRKEMWDKLEGYKVCYQRRPRSTTLFQLLGPLVAEREAVGELVKRRPEVKCLIETDIIGIEEAREFARTRVKDIRLWEQIDLNYHLNGSQLMGRRVDKGK